MKRLALAACLAAAAAWGSAPALAHQHEAVNGHQGDGQVLANGQNHPVFISGVSCDSYPAAAGGPVGPAWYGLETAHHGPDAGDSGRGDGCYQTTGSVPPGQDVANPAIGP
jgi:hypothetical protein